MQIKLANSQLAWFFFSLWLFSPDILRSRENTSQIVFKATYFFCCLQLSISLLKELVNRYFHAQTLTTFIFYNGKNNFLVSCYTLALAYLLFFFNLYSYPCYLWVYTCGSEQGLWEGSSEFLCLGLRYQNLRHSGKNISKLIKSI